MSCQQSDSTYSAHQDFMFHFSTVHHKIFTAKSAAPALACGARENALGHRQSKGFLSELRVLSPAFFQGRG